MTRTIHVRCRRMRAWTVILSCVPAKALIDPSQEQVSHGLISSRQIINDAGYRLILLMGWAWNWAYKYS